MVLILGAFTTTSTLTYPLGAVAISLPKANESGFVAAPKAAVGAGAQDPANYVVLPEIKHVFRPDAKQAPFVVSLAFSGLTLAPWVVLLAGVGNQRRWAKMSTAASVINRRPSEPTVELPWLHRHDPRLSQNHLRHPLRWCNRRP